MYDSEGNQIMIPLNLDCCLRDVWYENGSLVFTDSSGQETRICTDGMVDDRLSRISGYWENYSAGGNQSGDFTTALAQITSKVLVEFLQTPDGIKSIEKELNNYFNGTS